MKRIISLCCVCLILVMSLSVPVRADENISNYFNVLDYSGVNNSNSYFAYVNAGSNTFTFEMPFSVMASYVDLVFHTSGVAPSSVYYSYNNSFSDTELNLLSLGDNYFRVYGNVSRSGLSEIYLVFNFPSSSWDWISFDKFYYWENTSFQYDIEAYCDIETYNYSNTIHYVPTDLINNRSFTSSDDFDNSFLSLYLYTYDWKKYDYVEYTFLVSCSHINSINCFMGTDSVPIEVSEVYNEAGGITDYVISVIVDLRNLDRTIDDFPMILVEGNVVVSSVTQVAILGVVGRIESSIPDSNTYFYREIWSSIVSGFSNLKTWIESQTFVLQEEFLQLRNHLTERFSTLFSWLSTHFNSLESLLTDRFSTLYSWLNTHFSNLQSLLSDRFETLYSWLNTHTNRLESAIRGDTGPGDSFQDEVVQKDQELNDMAAVMDSVTKPAIQDINVSVDQYVKPADVQVLASPLTVFFEADLFRTMIIMSILLATVSYTLYGKR